MSPPEPRLAVAVASGGPSVAAWMRRLKPYRKADRRRAVVELLVTLGPFAVTWALMAMALEMGWPVLYGLLLPLAAGLLVRVFMIQHDCGHGSFLPGRKANDWTGRLLGVLTQTPYDYWRRSHAVHHASVGNLDARGIGDIDTLSVREYLARGRWGRLKYRFYRHPLVMFGIGPAYLFLIQHRYPRGLARYGATPWVSVMATNLGIVTLAAAGMALVGPTTLLAVQLPIAILAATAGVWLFYVQHQFEETYWAAAADWSAPDAALRGSSHLDLPQPLRWFSANIGLHHVHHLSSGIPYYRLPDVLRDHPELSEVNRLTLGHGIGCLRLVLWDEAAGRLISFRELAERQVPERPVEGAMPRLPVDAAVLSTPLETAA
ncbi:fatty acid desaturase [Oharaeibacter diazotrophicus]|uniref:Omega-6 fatty acid desaturase (Delta-12 desaturase) n=1 Tax=Oharaeibacter diazotrophicus TaxID=1920512 RepID=A0A4R6RDL1_9HYPH|nr:fatty acid desaturase [Oharaeibacter diazotrophicus]TDP84232.1 omega-6 fatty acid desaturase (delta-12 desaturase) [Oharaeibacter diazotrophicus]BBE73270.1 fatty acid desaturase [Pleomorphomonas sp. SM30]GLS75060.1 fatty acid desaturase [Oharaeibacter diazotrophicus]